MNYIYKQCAHLNTVLNFCFILKTLLKSISVLYFDLRIFAVYGHGARKAESFNSDERKN